MLIVISISISIISTSITTHHHPSPPLWYQTDVLLQQEVVQTVLLRELIQDGPDCIGVVNKQSLFKPSCFLLFIYV